MQYSNDTSRQNGSLTLRQSEHSAWLDKVLTAQILDLCHSRLYASQESTVRRQQFVEKIERICRVEWPERNVKVNVFGSSANGLATSTSDVDICLTTDWRELEDVKIVAQALEKHGMKSIKWIAKAKVPLVRFIDPEMQLACDINVNHPLAIYNTQMVHIFVQIDERVKPLAAIMRYWARRRDLDDAAQGGTFAPYTWLNLLINFLQMRNPPILPTLHDSNNNNKNNNTVMIRDGRPNKSDRYYAVNVWFNSDIDSLKGFGSRNKESVGRLLYEFFDTYCNKFDRFNSVISLRSGSWLSKREKGWHVGRFADQICVEEPFDTMRNLGNTADDVSAEGIIGEMKRALECLSSSKRGLQEMCDQYIMTP
ncbi:Nucleotidyltransferase, partial [Ramicandelaber brevisporus]